MKRPSPISGDTFHLFDGHFHWPVTIVRLPAVTFKATLGVLKTDQRSVVLVAQDYIQWGGGSLFLSEGSSSLCR